MTRRETVKCNECHYSTDAPDKIRHFVSINVQYDDEYVGHKLRLDFCSESCRDSFIEENEYNDPS